MKLGRRTAASAAGIVLIATLGACHTSARVHATGQAAGAASNEPVGPGQMGSGPSQLTPTCPPGQAPVQQNILLGTDAPGFPSPREALAANLKMMNTPATPDRFGTEPGSDATQGPVHYAARTNGQLRAVVNVEKLPSGGWIGESFACADFWTAGQ